MISRTTEDTIRRILREAIPDPRYEVFVFGSQARDDARPNSDIDIGIDGPVKVSLATIGRINGQLEESDIPLRVDVVDMRRTSDSFRRIAKQAKYLL